MEDLKPPHYLESTINTRVKVDRNTFRYQNVLETKSLNRWTTKKREQSTKVRKDTISGEERLANEEIKQSMNRRMNFLRNPRNNPRTVTKLITQATGPTTISEGSKNSNNLVLFECEPSQLKFEKYAIGESYTIDILIRNVSTISRMVRVIPPKSSSIFTITELLYPNSCSSGLIAPGMSITSAVVFRPQSLGDYEEHFTISTEGGQLKVPIIAHRDSPILSLPSVINIGSCLVGDAVRVVIPCVNSGGAATVTLFDAAEYDITNTKPKSEWEIRSIDDSPFTMYPVGFHLEKNQSIDLVIEFVPTAIGTFSKDIVAHFDNEDSILFTIQGESKDIKVSIVDINGKQINSSNKLLYDLFFDGVTVDSEQTQKLSIMNETGIVLEYEWILLPNQMKSSTSHIMQMAQNQIHERHLNQESVVTNDDTSHIHDPSFRTENDHMYNVQHDNISQVTSSVVTLPPTRKFVTTVDKNHNPLLQGHEYLNEFNTVYLNGFTIHPARGLLNATGIEGFSITFNPAVIDSSQVEAVFIIKGIPSASMPNPRQLHYLDSLKLYSHGQYCRLCAWLEELAVENTVEKYSHPLTQVLKTTNKVISLKDIMHVMDNYIQNEENKTDDFITEELKSYRIRCEDVMNHVNRWLQNAIQVDDDEDEETRPNTAGTNVDNDVMTRMPSKISETQPSMNRMESMQMSLSMSRRQSTEYPIDALNLLQKDPFEIPIVFNCYHMDNTNLSSNQLKHGAKVYPLKFKNEIEKNIEAMKLAENPLLPTIKDYDPLTFPSSIFIDSANAILLYGEYLSKLLNDSIKHQPIEYIRENSLTHVSSFNMKLAGKGKPIHISLEQPYYHIAGDYPIEKEWHIDVKIKNPSSTTIEMSFQLDNYIIRRLSHQNNALTSYQSIDNRFDGLESSTISSSTNNINKFMIQCNPKLILLPPESVTSATVTLRGYEIGSYLIFLPMKIPNLNVTSDCLTIQTTIVPSKLRFDLPEVDVGLIAVGQSQQVVLSFTNESDSYLKCSFSAEIEADADFMGMNLLSSRGKASSAVGGTVTPMSRTSRSFTSRSHVSHTHRSTGSETSPTGSYLSTDRSYQIESSYAMIIFESNDQIISPYSSSSVNIICKAGKLPQRLRGTITCHIHDSHGLTEINQHLLNVRGEIQTPKAIISPSIIDLRDVYIGVPTKFQLSVINLCNLPTKYKIDYPLGKSLLYNLEVDEEKGVLGPKEHKIIHGVITALEVCNIDDVFSVKIFGLPKPIGFSLHAKSKSVCYEIIQLQNTEMPKPLCLPTASQFIPIDSRDVLPEPSSSASFSFGNEIALYERRSIRLAIRNLSSIPIEYKIYVEKYPVKTSNYDQLVQEFLSSQSYFKSNHLNFSSHHQKIPIADSVTLKDHQDNPNKRFQSYEGKKYISSKMQYEDDKKYLQSKLGASYLIDPNHSGTILPWDVMEIRIHEFNDVPGYYDDIFVFQYTNPLTNQYEYHRIPIHMTVHGCPLHIEKNTTGMGIYNDISSKKTIPLLRLGQGFVNSDPLKKQFIVKNNGSSESRLKWTLESDNDRVSIEPLTATISGYDQMIFYVTLTQSNIAGSVNCMATGLVMFSEDGDDPISETVNIDSTLVTDPKNSKHLLTFMIQGEYCHPILQIGKKLYKFDSNELELSVNDAIKLSIQAPMLIQGRDSMKQDNPSNPGICNRMITITNPMEAEASLNISVDGPYALICNQNKKTSKSRHTNTSESFLKSTSFTTKLRESVDYAKTDIKSNDLILGPHVSQSYTLTYIPTKSLYQSLKLSSTALTTSVDSTVSSTEESGLLSVQYNSGQLLTLPIKTIIQSPFIFGSSSALVFGVCHVEKNCQGLFLLSNGTNVKASWNVVPVENGGTLRRFTDIPVKGYEDITLGVDDPSVFEITPSNGVLHGPSMSTTATTAAMPKDDLRGLNSIIESKLNETSWKKGTLSSFDNIEFKQHQHTHLADPNYPTPIRIIFKPKKNVKYSCRYRFICEYGNAFDVILTGQGTFEEHEHKPQSPAPN